MTAPEWVSLHWDSCKAWLLAALAAEPVPTHNLAHVRAELDSGRAQLWPTQGAAVVTTVERYPAGSKGICYWLAGGDLEEVLKTHEAVETFARQQGCTFIEIRGRRGWLPAVKRLGFEPAGTYYIKRLDDEKAEQHHH